MRLGCGLALAWGQQAAEKQVDLRLPRRPLLVMVRKVCGRDGEDGS